ncbi:family 16 glycoside hydrolase [Paenibacillus oryzisoli]|uniref:family 16 glycoside hydrolase n=1 Tax=Paenibacillus oryzisoli TaxID=1850517 RepID=UPI003D2A8F56
MYSAKKWLVIFSVFIILFSLLGALPKAAMAAGTIYYVDSSRPDDSGDGKSAATAWKSLSKVNATTFAPGDQILFKSGGTWTGQLYPKGSGVSGSPITLSSYGSGSKPLINGGGLTMNADGSGGAAVYLYNQEYWVIKNLEVTNTGATAAKRLGVNVVASDYGTANYIHISNLTVHGVNGINTDKKNGGIAVQALGTSVSTKWNDVLIENNTVYTVDATGIQTHSRWMNRGGMVDSGPWSGFTNVLIQYNTVYDTGRDGILVRVSTAPVIQYNVVHHANMRSGAEAVAIWPFNTDDALVQYNEAYSTHGSLDGQGFDSDYDSNRTIIQYNYSHDNEGGFVLICNNGTSNFNNGTIVRYNISQNDGTRIFQLAGPVTNTSIYNNTIYVKAGTGTHILLINDWGGYASNTSFKNNIIYNLGSGGYSFGSGTNTVFDYNVFYGNHPGSEPSDAHKLTSNPLLVSPGTGTSRTAVDGYKLQNGSPAIDSGVAITGNGGIDYWGSAVPANSVTDRGAYEGVGIPSNPAVTVFSDNFESGSSNWTTSGGTWSVVTDGTKVFNQSLVTGEALAFAGSAWTNYTYSSKVKLNNVYANAGLLFRVTDANNYYMLRINNSTNSLDLYKKVSGTLTLLTSASFSSSISTWYDLKVKVTGNTIDGSVNNTQLITYTNSVSELTTGKIGYRMAASTASFDDAVVTQ